MIIDRWTPAVFESRLPFVPWRQGTRERLLHRQALGEIARLIDVRALEHRNVVGEQLHGNGENDRSLQNGCRDRQLDDGHSVLAFHARLWIGEYVQFSAARARLLKI